jgi:hypothetical protein
MKLPPLTQQVTAVTAQQKLTGHLDSTMLRLESVYNILDLSHMSKLLKCY